MGGRETKAYFRNEEHEVESNVLEVEGLTLVKPGGKGLLLDNVSFSLRAGEMLGIYGLMGAGRTELLESLIGVRPEAHGSVRVAGKELLGHRISERIRQGLMLVPEDRQRLGLVQTLSVRSNM